MLSCLRSLILSEQARSMSLKVPNLLLMKFKANWNRKSMIWIRTWVDCQKRTWLWNQLLTSLTSFNRLTNLTQRPFRKSWTWTSKKLKRKTPKSAVSNLKTRIFQPNSTIWKKKMQSSKVDALLSSEISSFTTTKCTRSKETSPQPTSKPSFCKKESKTSSRTSSKCDNKKTTLSLKPAN